MSPPFLHPLRVRYGECDPQGIVFNANYLLYFDVGFTELWRAAAGPWRAMVDEGFDAVVAESHLSFHAPARVDDELTLALTITRLGRTALTTEIEFLRDAELLAQGWLRHVCVATADWRKAPLPERIRVGLRSFAAPGAEEPGAGRSP